MPDERSTYAARLRTWRERAGLSQGQAAAAAGMSQAYISRLEAAEHSPSIETLDRLAGAYGCEVYDLLQDPDLAARCTGHGEPQ